MDKKIIDWIVKHKFKIVLILAIIFFFRSCGRGLSINKLEKSDKYQVKTIDSLENIIEIQKSKIDSFPEILRTEKLRIYLQLDDTISRVDRSPQLMGLHKMIKNSVRDLQK